MCSNPLAINYTDESNGPCIGECDNAPLFYGLAVTDPAAILGQKMAFLKCLMERQVCFCVEQWICRNDTSIDRTRKCPDYTIDLPILARIRPGCYIGTLLNAEGALVSQQQFTAPHLAKNRFTFRCHDLRAVLWRRLWNQ